MPIQAYIHCATCTSNGDKDVLEVGMSDPQTLTVHCATCDQDVGTFKLAKALPPMVCHTCGEPIGPGHLH